MSDMEIVYSTELVQQARVGASAQGDEFMSELEATKEEIQELKNHANVYEARCQELNEALEVEEAKTDAERLARQEAEATTRQHRAEISKFRRNEVIANEHCDAAESECIELQKLLATERSSRVAADRIAARLREDLSLAEINERSVYDQLNHANVQIRSLREDKEMAEHCIAVLTLEGEEMKSVLRMEHQRFMEAVEALGIAAEEARCTEDRFSDLVMKYDALKAVAIEPAIDDSMALTAFDPGSVAVDVQSPIDLRCGTTLEHLHIQERVTEIHKVTDKTMIVEAIPSMAKDRPSAPTEMPAFPEPVTLRPAHASSISCPEESFETTARYYPATDTASTNLRWKFFCRIPANFLQGLCPSIC